MFKLLSIRKWTCLALMLCIAFSASGSICFGEQTRDQCRECCRSQGLDEYYTDQCILKCFRNSDHCQAKPSREALPPKPEPRERVAEPAPQNPQPAPPPQPLAVQPPQDRPVPAAKPRPAPAPAQSGFNWPNPLNLVPGKEIEAAGQILAANGVMPQHPQFQAAAQAIEQVLVNFARSNPSGGKLPTAQLEQILRQLR